MTKPVILPGVYTNRPVSQSERDRYPEDRYPIRLVLQFNRRNRPLHALLKSALRDIPKSQVKYRFHGRYTKELDCYAAGASSLKPLFDRVLPHTDLWERYGGKPDRQITPAMLFEQIKLLDNSLVPSAAL